MNLKRYESWDEFLSPHEVVICGILNITPDSFSDGGMYLEENEIKNRIEALIDHGAKMIDVGAESTRPGSVEVTSDTELERLKPFFNILNDSNFDDVLFSLDTRHSDTAAIALKEGVQAINDVSGGRFDERMGQIIADSSALYIAMHSRSIPQKMQEHVEYQNIIEDIENELKSSIEKLKVAGVKDSQIMIDPGIGFAKTSEQNLSVLENIHLLKQAFDYPMMVGISRKSMIGHLIAQKGLVDDIDSRDQFTAEICQQLVNAGVEVLRVHNVSMVNQYLTA